MAITSASVTSYNCYSTSVQVNFSAAGASGDYLFIEIWQGGVKIRDTYVQLTGTTYSGGSSVTLTASSPTLDVRLYAADHATNYGSILNTNCAYTPPCNIYIGSISTTADNGSNSGTIHVIASNGIPLQYSLDNSTWQGSSTFTGLAAGTYHVYLKDANNCTANQANVVVASAPCTLTGTMSKTDVTTYGGSNGTITFAPSGGSGNYEYTIFHSSVASYQTTGVFTGLGAGYYDGRIKDLTSGCIINFSGGGGVTINAPARLGIVNIPIVNSLRFVKPCTPDNCATFQNFDNTLFYEEQYPGIPKRCYFQKVAKCDDFKIQWQSNYGSNEIEVTNIATGAVNHYPAHTINSADLPTGYVLPTTYNLVEAQVDWISLANGYYSVALKGSDSSNNPSTYTAPGEPVFLQTQHPATNLITFSNFEQDFGIEYLTGIVHRVRVESRFMERENPGKRTVYVDGAKRTVKLAGSVQRKVKLTTFQLPPYLQEKLSIAFEHDNLKVNNIEYQLEENTNYRYLNLFHFVNGEALLTQVNFYFNNTTDSGPLNVPSAGFLAENNGDLLKL